MEHKKPQLTNEGGFLFGHKVTFQLKKNLRGKKIISGYVIGTTEQFCYVALEPIFNKKCDVVRKKNNQLSHVWEKFGRWKEG